MVMNVALISRDKDTIGAVKNMVNTMGHMLFVTDNMEECKLLRDKISLFIVDLHETPLVSWEKCTTSLENEDMGDIYVVALAGRETMEEAEEVLNSAEYLDKIITSSDNSEVAEILKEVLDEMELEQLSHLKEYDPIKSLREDHYLLKKQNHILEVIRDNLTSEDSNSRVPDEILRWAMRATRMMDKSIHHEKEHAMFYVLINRITETGQDWAADLSKASFLEIEEEHKTIEELLRKIDGALKTFLERKEGGNVLKALISEYVYTMEMHISLEEATIFPFAQDTLVNGDRLFLTESFSDIHREQGTFAKVAEEIILLYNAMEEREKSA